MIGLRLLIDTPTPSTGTVGRQIFEQMFGRSPDAPVPKLIVPHAEVILPHGGRVVSIPVCGKSVEVVELASAVSNLSDLIRSNGETCGSIDPVKYGEDLALIRAKCRRLKVRLNGEIEQIISRY